MRGGSVITRASRRQVPDAGDECLGGGTDNDPRSGEIPTGSHRGVSVRFNQGQVPLAGDAGRGGQIPDSCVKVEDRRWFAADQLRDATGTGDR